MALSQIVDPALLRAFVFVAEEGSFTRAANRVGRTQSAVSLQLQRLEALLGHPLLLRGKGGTVQLTAHGSHLLEQARELLALNDRIWAAFRAPALHGIVRLGCPDDYALRYLPAVLRRFAVSHPAVDVDVMCLPSRDLAHHLRGGDLDLMICSDVLDPLRWQSTPLWRGPLVWITSAQHAPHRLDPLPLALAVDSSTSNWRHTAVAALQAVGRRYRVAYNSASLAGTYAPVMAGLAVTVSNITDVPPGLRVLLDGTLPHLGEAGIDLVKARNPRQPVTDVLADHIAETFRSETQRAASA